MNAQHTPGPWTVATRIAHDDSRLFAELNAARSDASVIIEAADPDEEQANARLIAAAPELLRALEFAKSEMHFHPATRNSEALEFVRAAIAKATGSNT